GALALASACQPAAAPARGASTQLAAAAPHEPTAPPAPPEKKTAAPNVPGPWDVPYPQRFDAATLPRQLGVIRVQGHRFVDASGATVILQGVNISDPDKLESNGHYDRRLFEEIHAWGANVVRIPVHPSAWRARGKAAYFELLDRAVL